jgi:two-component system CheB/CheR fusion protein
MAKKTERVSTKRRKQPGAHLAGDKPVEPTESGDKTKVSSGSSSSVPVVGMGGSAGSLAAFKTFFTSMPVDSGAAFVVIQHLAPARESLLPEILAQHTRMKVVQANDALPVQPNCVYVIPPNHYIVIREGVLFLTRHATHEDIRLPIDFFFRSLAEDGMERAICIVFSGAGSDGTLGVRAIRGAGGLTIAQEPQTAQFDSMPGSAVATGLVDFVLSPDHMPETVLNYLQHPYVRQGEQAAVPEIEVKSGSLQDILSLIKLQKGCDFSYYKQSTIVRRIERRMGLRQIADFAAYYDLLRKDGNEVSELFKDLLINVTSFFRDAEAFEVLRQKALAPLARAKRADEPLRIWVPGCASGEEAYSLAILLTEEVSAAHKNCPVQVFATDIDEEALEFARLGIYPESIHQDVSAEWMSRFFVKKDGGYQVIEPLRKSVVFAVHNLITDPPFSKMDLISCRNLLIYLDADTQARLTPLFNFALNQNGYLFLGKSEGTSGRNDLFCPVSKEARLFRRLVPARPIILDSLILPGKKRTLPQGRPAALKPQHAELADITRHAILSHFAASVVLVDRKGQILQFHGETGKYLNMPLSEPDLNLPAMAKEGLSARLRSALYRAIKDNTTVMLDNVPIMHDKDSPVVRVTISHMEKQGEAEPLLAVIFEDVPRPPIPAVELHGVGESETIVKQLEDELKDTQQELQATIEELRSSNEELRVANEEVVSTNEELQSTIEELETSQEELQSVNEELSIVNSQLQEKVRQLDAAKSDMANFLNSTEIAAIFLDLDLRIKLFTPAATRVLKLIPSDTGRPISDLALELIDFDLPSAARVVAMGGDDSERIVQHADGSHYLVRVLPYRALKDELDGVIVTFSDITRLRLAERNTRRLASIVADSNDAVILTDPDGNILAWNRGARDMYGWTEAEALQMTIKEMTPPDRIAEYTDLIRKLASGETVFSCESRRSTKDGRVLDVWLTASAVWDATGTVLEAIATTERDITDRQKAEGTVETFSVNEKLKQKISELETANRELEAFIYSVSHDLRAPLRSMTEFSRIVIEDHADGLDKQGKDYLARVRRGAEKMSRLVEGLLSLSRISRQKIELTEFDMSKAALAIISELRKTDTGRSVGIDIQQRLVAFGDPLLMEIVLSNLLENAWKFTSKTEKARIEFGAFEESGKPVYYMKDNGTGFNPEYMERMFMPFHRLHSDDEFAGTGIGLAIAERIIRRHGGRIWAEGKMGKGATIFFTLS